MSLGPGTADVPDLVPARMVNEFTYYPRLFFLNGSRLASPTTTKRLKVARRNPVRLRRVHATMKAYGFAPILRVHL